MVRNDQNKFSGERLDSISPLSRNNLLEHLARYKLVKGTRKQIVLDIGCGTGHGSFELAKSFERVIGVDISRVAIEYAMDNWKASNIEYKVGSGTKLSFEANTFDVAVAFEVFEHIKEWKNFLYEIRRVTKRNGKIYISTPNKLVYSPGTKSPINPHHKFEMTPKQFKNALRKIFTINKLYGQRTPVYNDHWIWKIVDPLLFSMRKFISYKTNNTIKLSIINKIKPELATSDIVFYEGDDAISKSRVMVAICANVK